MVHRRFGVAFIFSTLLALGACGGSNQPANGAEEPHMSAAEARAFIAEVQKERGTTPETGGVTNMDQLVDVLLRDDIFRFEDAVRLVQGKPGIDAMTMHATIEVAWSDGFSTVARVVDERTKRADLERQRLTQERDAGRKFTDAETRELEQAEKDTAFGRKMHLALDVLSVDHLQAAGAVVRELVRQFPEDPRTDRVAAFYYLLSQDFELYDTTMTRLEKVAATDAALQYLRALESLNRAGIRKEASAHLREALKLNPNLVRAQAKLVLTEEGIEAIHAELQKLKAVAPRHPIVNIAGPSIVSEYETSTALAKARASHNLPGPPPPEGAPPAPATAAPPPAPAPPAGQ